MVILQNVPQAQDESLKGCGLALPPGQLLLDFSKAERLLIPVSRALSLRLSFRESCHVSPKFDQIPFLRDRELTQSLFWISVPTS